MTAAAAVQGESFVATRDLRVACGEDCTVVDVKAGESWPHDAQARLDVLLRVGHVVRFDEDGVPDVRSRKFVRRLGIRPPSLYHRRTFEERARADALRVPIAGKAVRVLAGRPDGDLADLFVAKGRAFVLRRGLPDGQTAAGDLVRVGGDASGSPGRRSTKKTEKPNSGSPKKRRRRKPPRA